MARIEDVYQALRHYGSDQMESSEKARKVLSRLSPELKLVALRVIQAHQGQKKGQISPSKLASLLDLLKEKKVTKGAASKGLDEILEAISLKKPSTAEIHEILENHSSIDMKAEFEKRGFLPIIQDYNFTTPLNRMIFDGFLFKNCNFGDIEVKKVTFQNCEFRGEGNSQILNTFFENVNFENSRFKNVDFVNNRFTKSQFKGVEFSSCSLINPTVDRESIIIPKILN